MLVKINKKYGEPLIVDSNEMTGFKESGKGYDISFSDDTYYFSLEDAQYFINEIFKM
jgi:hypothetical protein